MFQDQLPEEITEKIQETFFNAISEPNIKNVMSILAQYPSLIISSPYDELPFEEAESSLHLSKNLFYKKNTAVRRK